jgi:hypothetical protein
MAQDTVARDASAARDGTNDKLAPAQGFERSLDGAFGESRHVCDHAQAGRDRSPSGARRLAVKIEINEVGRRLAVVPDEVAHQDIEHVIIDWNSFAKTRHIALRAGYLLLVIRNEASQSEVTTVTNYTDKRTRLSCRARGSSLDAITPAKLRWAHHD